MNKKTLRFLMICTLTIAAFISISPSASATEKAMFPMEYLNISQGVNGQYSHMGRLAIDIWGKDSGTDAFYAPFTGTIKKIHSSNNVVWLESNSPVEYADGTVDYMTIMCMHDNDISDLWVGKTIDQGEQFYSEGIAGNATGNHVHLECGKGKFTGSGWYENSYGKWCINNGINPWQALYLSESTVVGEDFGYPWKKVVDTQPPSYYVVCNTSEASSITATSAVFSGTFTNPASAKIIKRGYQWGATPEMCNYTEFDCNITWDDGLSHNMTNLSPNTTYYYKLVVKCEDGSYIYGNTKTVTTLSMPDTEKPVISNLFARDISSKSFTIQCNLYDNSNIARVWFVVYSPDGEYQFGTGASNGIFSYKFDTENYGGAGIYSVHIYAFDENDNSSGMYSTGEFLVEDDNVSPTIENISVSNIGNKVFEIKCDLKDNVGIVRMWMVIYAPNGEHQFEIPASQGEFIYPINTELYGGIGEYVVHMYAFDAAENSSGMYSTGSLIPEYYIKFNLNGGNGNVNQQIKKYTDNLIISDIIPIKDNYRFINWNTAQDGSGVSYLPGDTYTKNENLVLYAQWERTKPYLEATVTKSGSAYIVEVSPFNIENSNKIIVASYNNDKLITAESKEYSGSTLEFTASGTISEIKIMAWNSLSYPKPLCETEIVNSSEFISE